MIKFGTGGWRAIIGEDFIKDNVCLVAQAIADIMNMEAADKKGFVLGYDRRFLSDKAAKWIAQVLAANKVKVYLIEKYAPTPMIMFTIKKYGAYYGAAVTASHNPPEYNGIKVFTYGGRDAKEDVTEMIEKQIQKIGDDDIKIMDFDNAMGKGFIEFIDPFNDYIDSILSIIDVDAVKKSRLKILFDPMFGASKITLNTVLTSMRCQVATINTRHDPLFGGRLPSPNSYTLKLLMNLVPEKGYDLGLGTDGDGDRLGIIDERGNFIHPNKILCLLYYYFLEYKGIRGGVVRNIATTHILDKIAKAYGEKSYEVPVGFKHISYMMENTDAIIGGESSGGLTIKGHVSGKDATLAASLIIEMVSVTGKRIGELLREIDQRFGYYYMEECDVKFDSDFKGRIDKILFQDRELPNFNLEISQISYQDGVKVYFENDGWIVLRFSGTEPLLRICSEMPAQDQAGEVIEIMNKFIEECGSYKNI